MQALEKGARVAGRYEILERLLEGRFSTLFRAHDRLDGVERALRVFRPGESAAEQARLQLLREGRFLARLQHRGLPRVLQTLEEEGRIVLVLEELPARTLESLVAEQGPLPVASLQRFLGQLLQVATYLHGLEPPLVHRDLRPDTVLVGPGGNLVLAEFGLARMVEAGADGATAFRAHGSPHYAAPEQLLQMPSHPGNDLYALGAVAWFMATGSPPPRSLERYAGQAPTRPLREVRADLPAPLEALIACLMEPQSDRRPDSAEGAARRLAEAAPPGPASATLRQAVKDSTETSRATMWDMLFGASPTAVAAAEQSGPAEEDLARFPLVDLATFNLDPKVARLLPEAVSRSVDGVCIGQCSPSELTLAVKDPTQVHIYDHVSFATQGRCRPVLMRAEAGLIELAREYAYRASTQAGCPDWLQWMERKKFATDSLDVKTGEEVARFGSGEVTSPVVTAVDRILKEAISVGASDIHLETYETELVVRYRIDGVLHVVERLDRRMAPGVAKRVKILAGMDIAQERTTQGGRISLQLKDQAYDLRVSVVPVVSGGENVVMRLLRKGTFDLRLADLGLEPRDDAVFRRLLAQPHGMILVTGPTGSGKSTTLYGSLAEIVRPDRKLLTVEDPVEYQMPGVTQVQVNLAPREEEQRLTFSKALREFLRQDPDVILVGEIRDPETAGISVQAALTGHLVLSTLHTNDAIGIVARMVDMGVEPYLLASTLLGGLAQRLVRKVCSECREPIEVAGPLGEMFRAAGIADPTPARGRGCLRCHGTGYRGRMGLFEVLEVTPEIRELVAARAPAAEIRRAAEAGGLKCLYEDGLRKAARGLVTVEEVQRVCLTL